VADTRVPMTPPASLKLCCKWLAALAAKAMPIDRAITTNECPREKKKPTPSGRLPFCSR